MQYLSMACAVLQATDVGWLNTAVLQRVSAAKVVHQVRGITNLGGGRRFCIICRRHWSDYGQTYNIQKTAIQAS